MVNSIITYTPSTHSSPPLSPRPDRSPMNRPINRDQGDRRDASTGGGRGLVYSLVPFRTSTFSDPTSRGDGVLGGQRDSG